MSAGIDRDSSVPSRYLVLRHADVSPITFCKTIVCKRMRSSQSRNFREPCRANFCHFDKNITNEIVFYNTIHPHPTPHKITPPRHTINENGLQKKRGHPISDTAKNFLLRIAYAPVRGIRNIQRIFGVGTYKVHQAMMTAASLLLHLQLG